MFNPFNDSLSSTGEPPTVSPVTRRNNLSSSNISQPETSQLSHSSGSSRSLSVQEPDSGYEASPSSIADNQRFFGEQPVAAVENPPANQSPNVDEECDVIELHSQILLCDSESDELDYDTCRDCSSPHCCCRTDSSNTYATAVSNCDNSSCNSIDPHRPSSQPVEIPNLPWRIRSNGHPQIEIFGTLGSMYPYHRSQPLDFSPLHRLGSYPQHVSWPPSASQLRNRRYLALPSPRDTVFTHVRDIPNTESSRRCNHPVRSRRQIIDSEASSFCSSDEEGPEDVFNMPTEASSYHPAMTVGSGPLPDVVLESTDSGRRSRSMSVNLPPSRERAIHIIGQNLRRMSDLFEQRQQFSMAVRRRTSSDCYELRRNGLP